MRVVGITSALGIEVLPFHCVALGITVGAVVFAVIICRGVLRQHVHAQQPFLGEEPIVLKGSHAPALAEALLALLHGVAVVEIPVALQRVELGFAVVGQLFQQFFLLGLFLGFLQFFYLVVDKKGKLVLRQHGHGNEAVVARYDTGERHQ